MSEDAAIRRAEKRPAARSQNLRKLTRRSKADENTLPPLNEEDFDLDIDPLYRPELPRTTRSGRVSKANPRPNM